MLFIVILNKKKYIFGGLCFLGCKFSKVGFHFVGGWGKETHTRGQPCLVGGPSFLYIRNVLVLKPGEPPPKKVLVKENQLIKENQKVLIKLIVGMVKV
jgi:hypothetical protein